MQQHSFGYTVAFAGVVCMVCAVLVSSSAVLLKERQTSNKILDRQEKVLDVAGLLPEQGRLGRDAVKTTFRERIRPRVIDLVSGEAAVGVDAATFDQRVAAAHPATSREAPANKAKVRRLPQQALIYEVVDSGQDGRVDALILPVEGKGLWSTLYGFLALAPDTRTVRGITFYEHGETPGLGGEVDNQRWKALWVGRDAFDASWEPALTVIKGQAGSVEADPHRIDGLSGATLTSRGVSNLVEFWLGDNGFGPFLRKFREKRG